MTFIRIDPNEMTVGFQTFMAAAAELSDVGSRLGACVQCPMPSELRVAVDQYVATIDRNFDNIAPEMRRIANDLLARGRVAALEALAEIYNAIVTHPDVVSGAVPVSSIPVLGPIRAVLAANVPNALPFANTGALATTASLLAATEPRPVFGVSTGPRNAHESIAQIVQDRRERTDAQLRALAGQSTGVTVNNDFMTEITARGQLTDFIINQNTPIIPGLGRSREDIIAIEHGRGNEISFVDPALHDYHNPHLSGR